jgi:Tol biopolymer transport system component
MTRRTLLALAATIVAVLLAGCGGTPQDGSNSQNGSNRQGRSEAANANSVGRCAGNVSTRRQQEGRGEDSNDTQIAFTRVIAGEPTASGPYATQSELYVMNADGTNETRLTNTPESYAKILATSPDWSPDGKRIAYLKGIDVDTGRTDRDIYVINADGSNPSSLTTVEQSTIAWSPDGTKIAFKSASSGNDDIYVINADGSGRTNLTNTKRSEDYVTWSPARVGTITERT